MTCKCPHCDKEISPASLLGSIKSEIKSDASRNNGKKGGRPRKEDLAKQRE